MPFVLLRGKSALRMNPCSLSVCTALCAYVCVCVCVRTDMNSGIETSKAELYFVSVSTLSASNGFKSNDTDNVRCLTGSYLKKNVKTDWSSSNNKGQVWWCSTCLLLWSHKKITITVFSCFNSVFKVTYFRKELSSFFLDIQYICPL